MHSKPIDNLHDFSLYKIRLRIDEKTKIYPGMLLPETVELLSIPEPHVHVFDSDEGIHYKLNKHKTKYVICGLICSCGSILDFD